MLFSLSDMTAEIEGGSSAFRLFWIHYVMVHPDNPDQLFVVVLSTLNRRAYVLTFDRTSNEVRYLMSSMANHSLGLSPDGRYLILAGTDHAGEENALLQVYDLTRQETLSFLSPTVDFPPFPTYDWSLDGNWLALLLDDNTLGFFAPDQKQLHLVETPPGDCGTPAWINQ
jgi:dipeptidyl aminopeptidase/acylaminoacyl peptidase